MRSFYALKMVFGGDKFRRGKDEGFMAPKKTKVRDENVSSAATAFRLLIRNIGFPPTSVNSVSAFRRIIHSTQSLESAQRRKRLEEQRDGRWIMV